MDETKRLYIVVNDRDKGMPDGKKGYYDLKNGKLLIPGYKGAGKNK